VAIVRTETALGAFYRRHSARVGKAKGITATARKIAVLFYNALSGFLRIFVAAPRPSASLCN
jgi:hypothetical protein